MRKSWSQVKISLCTAVVIGLVAGTALGQQNSNPDNAPAHADTRKLRKLTWDEVRSAHAPALDERGWDKSYVLDTFDHDHDAQLNREEYRMLVLSLQVDDPDATAPAVGADSSAAESHINRPLPDVVSNPLEMSNPTLPRDPNSNSSDKNNSDKSNSDGSSSDSESRSEDDDALPPHQR